MVRRSTVSSASSRGTPVPSDLDFLLVSARDGWPAEESAANRPCFFSLAVTSLDPNRSSRPRGDGLCQPTCPKANKVANVAARFRLRHFRWLASFEFGLAGIDPSRFGRPWQHLENPGPNRSAHHPPPHPIALGPVPMSKCSGSVAGAGAGADGAAESCRRCVCGYVSLRARARARTPPSFEGKSPLQAIG